MLAGLQGSSSIVLNIFVGSCFPCSWKINDDKEKICQIVKLNLGFGMFVYVVRLFFLYKWAADDARCKTQIMQMGQNPVIMDLHV